MSGSMKPLLKKVLLGVGASLGALTLGLGGYVFVQTRAFDASMEKVYPTPLPALKRSDDPEVRARGAHLAQSLGGCSASECHGSDLAGGKLLDVGPVGSFMGPNITAGGMLAVYSDAELARLLRTGVKKDGRSVRFMPVQDFSWFPDSDLVALISYLRTVKTSDKPNGTTTVGTLGKVLDRQGKFIWDVARRVEGLPKDTPPAPEPTRQYGDFLLRLCTGCHGETLSGGPLPGAPPSLPVPQNITLHESGIKKYSYEDFVKLLKTGIRKDGAALDPFMAVELTKNLDDIELGALWAAISARPPKAFGGR
jgi:mono/diheme cytochrome c family protein